MSHDEQHATTHLSLTDLKARAAALAEALQALPDASVPAAATGGGSLHRGLPAGLQQQFIDLRGALFERGIFDPVLVRFDTATAPPASTTEVAGQLAAIAGGV